MSGLPFDVIAEARRQWTAHGWGDAADGMSAVTSVMRAQQILAAKVDAALRPFDLTFARYEVLMLLWFSRTGSLPLRVIGSRLQVHPTSVTNAVDRLEAAGLVERVSHPEDRRTTLARLTDAGRERAEAATKAMNAEVFTDLGVDEARVRQVTKVLGELRRAAGDF